MTETKTATRYTPDDAILSPFAVQVPDNEHGTIQYYPGYTVTLPASDAIPCGYIWWDASMWCWKVATATGSGYGRCKVKRFAIAALLDVVQQ